MLRLVSARRPWAESGSPESLPHWVPEGSQIPVLAPHTAEVQSRLSAEFIRPGTHSAVDKYGCAEKALCTKKALCQGPLAASSHGEYHMPVSAGRTEPGRGPFETGNKASSYTPVVWVLYLLTFLC